MAMHCCGSGQVPRGKHQYKDASEHTTQQSISTITQWEDEGVPPRRGKRETFSTLQLTAVGVNMLTFCLYSLQVCLLSLPQSITKSRKYFITF